MHSVGALPGVYAIQPALCPMRSCLNAMPTALQVFIDPLYAQAGRPTGMLWSINIQMVPSVGEHNSGLFGLKAQLSTKQLL